ncbi:peroxisomal ATPase PEX6-like [Neocloeon triangulifer]|uniref:peroxisomal ATPase PEX6-like n=1 Tax=Neocloeon triangulifer TaxID=2078957 RepID=UPI00286EDDD4|nr:peroxisomal ATPase PEX6-like [Neocloeon triangulifer]
MTISGASNNSAKIEVFLSVLKYIVKVVARVRMAALERRAKVIPVSVPSEIFKDYLANEELDENHCVIVHPSVAESLKIKDGEWVWVHNSDEQQNMTKLSTSDFVRTDEMILPDALFFNVSRGACDNDYLLLSPSLIEKLPKAVSFDLSLQKYPTGWVASDIDTLLAEYFKTPRPVSISDVFCISIRNYAQEMFYSKLSQDLESDVVWFKVESLESAGQQVDPNKRLCFEASRQQTRVALVPSSGGGIPGKMDCFPGHHQQYQELERAIRLYLDPKYFKVLHKGRGLILNGRVGCEELYRAVAKNLGLNLIVKNCRELNMPTGNVGQIEGKLKQLAAKVTANISPSLIVFENIDVLGHDHESSSTDAEDSRLTMCLSTVLNSMPCGKSVVLGVTARPKNIVLSINRTWLSATTLPLEHPSNPETCLRHYLARIGYYQSEIPIDVPRMGVREMVLLVREAVKSKIQGLVNELDLFIKGDYKFEENRKARLGEKIDEQYWRTALENLKICSQEVVANIPKVSWEDVGGLEEVRKEVLRTVSLPIKFPFLRKSGLKRSGILLYGPPGTGKTLVAKAVASECGLSFISVKGAELLSMYVGQSEENVRDVFLRARQVAPSIIFFDELDALAPSRGQGGDGGGNVSDRVVSQLMAEMDGIEQNLHSSGDSAPVFVMAATNRVDLVEAALLRPGRFDKLMYVGPCKSDEAKLGVLKALTRKFELCDDVKLEIVIDHLPDVPLTGADLYGVCAEAWKNALRERIVQIQQTGKDDKSPVKVGLDSFFDAAANMRTSVSPEELAAYENEANKQNIQ